MVLQQGAEVGTRREVPVSLSAVGDTGGHLLSRCFTRVPGNSGGGCLSAMRCLGKQQCGTHGRHVGREEVRACFPEALAWRPSFPNCLPHKG